MNERRFGYLVPALVLSVLAAIVFAALAWSIHQENVVVEYDHEVAKTMETYRVAHQTVRVFGEDLGLQKLMEKVTNAGAPETLVVVAFVASVALLRLRQAGLTVVWILLITGGDYANKEVKGVFKRERPVVADRKPGKADSWSFPSGHSMDSIIGYGMLAYVLVRNKPRPWVRVVLALIPVLLIGFTRVYLNAHFPSDVIGGFAAGMVCLGVGICMVELLRGWLAPPQESALPPPYNGGERLSPVGTR